MKLGNLIFATLIGFGVHAASAGQVIGHTEYVGSVINDSQSNFSNTLIFSMNTASSSFYEWEEPAVFESHCAVPYVGYVVRVELNSEVKRQAAALLSSANATGQEVMISYTAVSNSNSPSGYDCVLDWVVVLGVN